jgi:GTP-dependent phosphoenolpyruvate carboxykinase
MLRSICGLSFFADYSLRGVVSDMVRERILFVLVYLQITASFSFQICPFGCVESRYVVSSTAWTCRKGYGSVRCSLIYLFVTLYV